MRYIFFPSSIKFIVSEFYIYYIYLFIYIIYLYLSKIFFNLFSVSIKVTAMQVFFMYCQVIYFCSFTQVKIIVPNVEHNNQTDDIVLKQNDYLKEIW